ncbi:hypothetical protein N431DRAFT_446116 [Stipitochalara longipes BDJ]|nr:hypothetical protein N431DRAFT_446116 [Stipitochalara longipes BDJ]
MSTCFAASLLFLLVSLTRADQFIFPEDMNADSGTPNQIFYLGEPQEFTWSTSAVSVVLELWQDSSDSSDTLSQNCSGGSYTWNGLITQDLSQGEVFFLQITDAAGKDGLATSRDFNISLAPVAQTTSIASNSSPSPQINVASSKESASVASSPASSVSLPSPSTTSGPGTVSTSKPAPSVAASSAPAQGLATRSDASRISEPSTPVSTSSSSTTTSSTSTPSAQSQASLTFTPLKLSLTIGLPVLSLALLAFILFFIRHRRGLSLVRAQSPPLWTAPTETVVPERKGPYERVEMEVPGLIGVKGTGEVGEKRGGGYAKAELGGQDAGIGEKAFEAPMGVELP